MNDQHVDNAVSEALNETLEPTSTELEDDQFGLDEADELGEPEGEPLKRSKFAISHSIFTFSLAT